jgi:hypothetical protein
MTRRRRKRNARINLPSLTAAEALRIVNVLDRAIAAIWRVHGADMADELALRGVDMCQAQSPDDVTSVPHPDDVAF